MRIECPKCGQHIELNSGFCSFCDVEQSDYTSQGRKRTIGWWICYILLWGLELILILAFTLYLMLFVGLIYPFSLSLKVNFLLYITLLIIIGLVMGTPVVMLGRYLLADVNLSKSANNSDLTDGIDLAAVGASELLGERINRFVNYLWSRFPNTVVLLLLYMFLNAINVYAYISEHSFYEVHPLREPSYPGEYVGGMFSGAIFILLFGASHLILLLGIGITLGIDFKTKKQKTERLQHSSKKASVVGVLLILGVLPTVILYGLFTKPWWSPLLFEITASPEEKWKLDMLQGGGISKYKFNQNNVNISDYSGRTPLMYAVLEGNKSLVNELISLGANLNETDINGYSPLLYAFEPQGKAHGQNLMVDYDAKETVLSDTQKEIIKTLLAKGSDPNIVAQNCATPLILAADSGSADIVKLILNAGGLEFILSPARTRHCVNRTPLMEAAQGGHNEVILLLLKQGMDINAHQQSPYMAGNGYTSLMYGIESGKLDTVELLLRHGAKVNVPDARGITPLMLASSKKEADVILRRLLQAGASVNDVGRLGETALSEAAQLGDWDRISLLHAKGARIDSKGKAGSQALLQSIIGGNINIVEFFLKQGVDPNSDKTLNQSILGVAIAKEDPHIVEALLKGGANPNHSMGTIISPLFEAATRGNEEIVSLLLKSGANVNSLNSKSVRTPLMAAIFSKESSCENVKLLLEGGADPNIVSPFSHKTALDLAEEKRELDRVQSEKLVSLLRQYGAKRSSEMLNVWPSHGEMFKLR